MPRRRKPRKPITEKRCSKCRHTKPVECFNKNRRMSDGYQNWCKACQNERSVRFYYEKQKPARQAAVKPVEAKPLPYACECCELRFQSPRELFMHQRDDRHFGPIMAHRAGGNNYERNAYGLLD